MKSKNFSWSGFIIRFCVVLALVFVSYNTVGHSYYHWAIIKIPDITSLMVFSGLILLIGWVIYIRATLRSLGLVGVTLATALFATLFWVLIDWQLIPSDNIETLTYSAQIILCLLMATGMSWSHVRRRISGQVDADDVDE